MKFCERQAGKLNRLPQQTMSDSNKTGHPLNETDQYSGKLFWLNAPRDYEIDLDELRDHLANRSFYEEIDTEEIEDRVVIPEVFKGNGEEVVRTTTIGDVSIVNSDWGDVILGQAVVDESGTVKYRGENILMLNNTDAKFLIFKREGHHYLAVIGRREIADELVLILKSKYDEFGSLINTTRLSHESLQNIREGLDADIVDTMIADYPGQNLESIRMRGTGLENEKEYERQKSKGKLRTHLLKTEELTPGTEKTISLSRDGLIRIYSNASVSIYLRLVIEYVLPEIHRDVESSPNLESYNVATELDTIFTNEDIMG